MDKMKDSGLTPVFVEGQPTFEEASLVLVCRKRYHSELVPEEIGREALDKWCAGHDYHVV